MKELPDQFVLKCNHASGKMYYEIVRDKSAVDWPSVLGRLERMLHTNYAKSRCEYQYNAIKPRVYAEEDKHLERPKGLQTILESAEILSKEFPFARIDFYDVNGKVYFGEITLTPDNCNIQHMSKEAKKTG